MVMHARKQPRLNDGFAERKDTHLHQNMQYQSKSLGRLFNDRYDRGGREGNEDRGREDVPGSHQSPRYQNKSSYIERNKEKRGGSSSQWEKSNHQVPSSSVGAGSSRGGGNTHSSGGYAGGGNSQNSHERLVKNTSKEQKDPKDRAEVHKSAVRVSGDWSEHISSSKKRYYYNCRTEVSQWEKPKEWVDSPRTPDNSRSKDGRNSGKPYSLSSSATCRVSEGPKHSSSGERDRSEKYPRSNSDSAFKYNEKLSPTDRPKIVYSKDVSNTVASLRTSNLQRTNSTPDSSAYKEGYSDQRKNNYPYSSVDPNRRRQRNESESSRSSIGHTTPQKNEDSNHADEMDISPGNTPTGSRSGKGPSSSSCTAALQTLQKLQQALNMHIARTQQNWAHTNHSQQHSSPQHHQHHQQHHQQQHHQKHLQGNQLNQQSPAMSSSVPHSLHPENGGGGHDSPISDISPCHSPAASTTSSQNVPVATSALSGVSIKKENTVELTPSLSNYYNEKLIGHVLGWQADHAERQANRYMEEALNVGSLHCSQVSVELKKARSLVRVAEIQSTLHEQRILFLDKQISEIDNLKPGTTFLPS